MADHNKPTVTSNYLDFVSEMHGRMDDLAVGFDPERTSATNVPNYSIRWSSAAKKWQYLDGSSWKDLTNEYAINISGTAQKLKTPRTIQITGGGSSDAVAFDGTKNIEIPLNSLDLDELEGLGSAAAADVVESTGSSTTNVMHQKAVTDALNSIDIPEVVTSKTDTSGGNKVITQGWMGVGNPIQLSSNDDLDDQNRLNGFYRWGGDAPANAHRSYGVMLSLSWGDGQTQIISDTSDNLIYRQRGNTSSSFRQYFVYHTGNILKTTGNNDNFPMSQKAVTDALNNATVSWGDISGKPSSFSPSSHNHSASNITSGTLPGARMPMGAGGVGTYAFLRFTGGGQSTFGSTLAGSNLHPSNTEGGGGTSPRSGTWRCLGFATNPSNTARTTLWVRIS